MKKIKALFASLTITRRELLLLLSGSAILAFGLYQVHSISGVTEGGVLGLTLLGHHLAGHIALRQLADPQRRVLSAGLAAAGARVCVALHRGGRRVFAVLRRV